MPARLRGNTGDVHVALSNGASFGTAQLWEDFFGINAELPMVGDVDAEDRADAIAFKQGAGADVVVSKVNAP